MQVSLQWDTYVTSFHWWAWAMLGVVVLLTVPVLWTVVRGAAEELSFFRYNSHIRRYLYLGREMRVIGVIP